MTVVFVEHEEEIWYMLLHYFYHLNTCVNEFYIKRRILHSSYSLSFYNWDEWRHRGSGYYVFKEFFLENSTYLFHTMIWSVKGNFLVHYPVGKEVVVDEFSVGVFREENLFCWSFSITLNINDTILFCLFRLYFLFIVEI